jgi:hypothetical protein
VEYDPDTDAAFLQTSILPSFSPTKETSHASRVLLFPYIDKGDPYFSSKKKKTVYVLTTREKSMLFSHLVSNLVTKECT